MASVSPVSGLASDGSAPPRALAYQVETRELSADFAGVGPEHPPRDLGAVEAAQFRQMLDRLAELTPIKLVDADPQLIVTVKSGRFLIQPQGGKLVVRHANALDQMFFKLTPAEISGFFQGVAPTPPQSFTTLIGSAAARVEGAPVPPAPARPPAKKAHRLRLLLLAALGVVALAAAGTVWIFRASPAVAPPPRVAPAATSTPRVDPAPAAPKPAPAPPEFDPIDSPLRIANLHERLVGTYATSGDAGERLLELRTDGTFHYQEFGSSLAVTTHQNGTYTFALRHGTQNPVLRAGDLGAIELHGDNSLVIRGAVFTRLPAAAK